MTEIQKGDWVYFFCGATGRELVFQCGSISGSFIWDTGNEMWGLEFCHRLTPLKPGEAKIGDRVAVIEKQVGGFDGGTIRKVEDLVCGMIEIGDHQNFYMPSWLTRLPDCAQTFRADPERCDQPSPDDSIWEDVVKPKPSPCPTQCPHHEWEGVYDYRGIGYNVRWSGEENCFRAVKRRCDIPGDPSFLCNADHYWGEDGPDETIWTQLEPAPTTSTAGPKLSRPQKHGGIKTPVDTW